MNGNPSEASGKDDGTTVDHAECIYCRSELKRGARYCKNCEFFQAKLFRSRRSNYVSVINASIGTILVGLTFFLDKLMSLDFMNDSSIVVANTECYRDRAFLTLDNRGRRHAIIGRGTVEAEGLRPAEEADVAAELDTSEGAFAANQRLLSIDPHRRKLGERATSVVEVRFLDPRSGKPSSFDGAPPEGGCRLNFTLQYQNFSSEKMVPLSPAPVCFCGPERFPQLAGENVKASGDAE